MPGVKDLIADPEYQALPAAKQREILSRVDPEFANLNDDQVHAFNLKSRGAIEKAFNPQLEGVTEGFSPEKRIRTFKDVGREVLPKLRPFIRGAGTAAGVGLSAATLGTATIPMLAVGAGAGLLSGLGTDLAVQEAEKGFGGDPTSLSATANLVPKGSTADSFAGAAEGLVGDELGSHAVRMLGRGFRGLIRPPAYDTINPMAQRLGDTYKQMIDYGGGPSYSQQNRGAFGHVESILGGAPQKTQLDNAARAGRAVSKDVLRKVTEQPEVSYGPSWQKTVVQQHIPGETDFKAPFEYPREMTQLLGARAREITDRANLHADKVRMIAQTKPFNSRITDSGTIESDKGPIVPTSMVLKADEFMRENFGADYYTRGLDQKFSLVADEEKPLIRTAMDILKYAKRDPVHADKILGVSPVPFDKAWKFKQEASGIGYGDDAIVSTYKNANFKKLGSAADDDIEKSVANWGKHGEEALHAYQTTKALISNRHDLYQQGDAITNLTKTAIGDSGRPDYDKILTDPLLTGKAIAAAGPGGRRNLQGYNLTKVLDDATDQTTGLFAKDKLLNSWKDPNKQEVWKKLYNSDQLAQINHFIEGLANVSEKQSGAGKLSAAWRVGSAGVNVAGTLLSSGLIEHGGALAKPGMVIGGMIATSEFVKQILLDPKKARAATILMHQGPSSSEGRFLSRQIFTALEGVAMTLQTKDGPVPGVIKNGKVTPLQND